MLLIDAPLGGSQKTALDAIKHGDLAAVGAAFTDGIPRYVGRSRNTPPITRKIKIVQNGSVLPTPFLDLSSSVQQGNIFQGLFGLTFHPDYWNNGYLYVYYAGQANKTRRTDPE